MSKKFQTLFWEEEIWSHQCTREATERSEPGAAAFWSAETSKSSNDVVGNDVTAPVCRADYYLSLQVRSNRFVRFFLISTVVCVRPRTSMRD